MDSRFAGFYDARGVLMDDVHRQFPRGGFARQRQPLRSRTRLTAGAESRGSTIEQPRHVGAVSLM
jgi:hypothetical protein